MGDMDGTSFVPQNLIKDANLLRLERAVQTACEAIYREREGYWPSDMERHHIAIALLAQSQDAYIGRSGGPDE